MRMRKLLIAILAVCGFAATGAAEDLIVMRNGDVVKAIVTEITPSEIKYKKASRPDGPLYTVDKSSVLSINYEDGEKDTFEEFVEAAAPAKSNDPLPKMDEESIDQINMDFYEKVNQDIEYLNEKAKAKNKNADAALCQYYIGENSIFNDGLVEVTLNFGNVEMDYKGVIKKFTEIPGSVNTYFKLRKHAFQPVVKNLTDQMIYLDLANTFFTENGISSPYFLPQSTAVTGSSTSGTSVNLGSVVGALGVGGIAKTLASGVNVGDVNTKTTQTVTYSQRIVSIPPNSSVTLDWKCYIPFQKGPEARSETKFDREYMNGYSTLCLKFPKDDRLTQGSVVEYDESNTPHQCRLYLTYSFTEDLANTHTISQDWYAKRLIGVRNKDLYYSEHSKDFGELDKGLWWGYVRCKN